MIPVSNRSEWIRATSGLMCPITTMNGYIYRVSPSPIYYNWSKDRFKSIKLNMHGDILSGAITSYEAIIEVDNSTLKIDNVEKSPVVSKDALKKLNGLQFYLEYGFESVSYITDLRFFVFDTQINTEQETVVFTVKSELAFMTAPYDYTNNPWAGTAYEIAEYALEQARNDRSVPKTILGFDYELDESMRDIQIRLDSQDYSIIEVLQIVANAAKCIIRVDNTSKIFIEPRNTEEVDCSISRFIQYSTPAEEVDPPISGCVFTCNGGTARALSSVTDGKYETLTNMSMIHSSSSAMSVARWVSDELAENPRTLSVQCRIDPRIELFDVVQFQNGSELRKVVVTDISLSYNGAWHGDIKARDNGADTLIESDDNIDVYNSMMEYIAAKLNGKGYYQPYTESFESLVRYLGAVLIPIATIDGEILLTVDGRPICCEKEW